MNEGAARGAAPAGSNPTVMDMLDHSAVAPLLHMSVNDIMRSLGHLPLPQIPPMPPLPQLPPLPVIDLSALLKPLTDLLSGFGSGDMSAAPFNPMQLFEGLQQALQSVVTLGTQAMSALAPLWTGPAATQAVVKSGEAAVGGTHTGTQSGDISSVVAMATATVGKGLALIQGVIADFVAQLIPLIGLATLPGGQAAIIASATAHLTTGLGIVAETRAELTAHTANMTRAGIPVQVTAVPQVAAQIPGMAMTSIQTVTQPIQSLIGAAAGARGGAGGGSAKLGSRQDSSLGSTPLAGRTTSAGVGGSRDGMPMAGALGGVGGGSPNAPLGPRAASDPLTSRPASFGKPGASENEETVVTRTAPGGAMPMGPAGAMGASPSNGGQHTSDREQVVDARHTEEIVGDIPAASPTVLGGVEAPTTQSIWDVHDEMDA